MDVVDVCVYRLVSISLVNLRMYSLCFIEKNRKEARKMLLTESLSSSRARADKLERILEEQRVRKNRYSAVISQQNRGELILSDCLIYISRKDDS